MCSDIGLQYYFKGIRARKLVGADEGDLFRVMSRSQNICDSSIQLGIATNIHEAMLHI